MSTSEYGRRWKIDDGLESVPESSNKGTSKSARPALGAKTGTKSKVWQYFGIEIEENGILIPVCRLCKD